MPHPSSLLEIAEKSPCGVEVSCPVCMDPLMDTPVSCDSDNACSGVFCLSCFLKAGSNCPLCRTECNGNYRKEKGLARLINNLKYPCPFCSKLVTVQEWKEHTTLICDEIYIMCPQHCGKKTQKKELSIHMKETCTMRKIICKRCKEEYTATKKHSTTKDCINGLKNIISELRSTPIKNPMKSIAQSLYIFSMPIKDYRRKTHARIEQYDENENLYIRTLPKRVCVKPINIAGGMLYFSKEMGISNNRSNITVCDIVDNLQTTTCIPKITPMHPSFSKSQEKTIKGHHSVNILGSGDGKGTFFMTLEVNMNDYVTSAYSCIDKLSEMSKTGINLTETYIQGCMGDYIRWGHARDWTVFDIFPKEEGVYCIIRKNRGNTGDTDSEEEYYGVTPIPMVDMIVYNIKTNKTEWRTKENMKFLKRNNFDFSDKEPFLEAVAKTKHGPFVVWYIGQDKKYYHGVLYIHNDNTATIKHSLGYTFCFTGVPNQLYNRKLNVSYYNMSVYATLESQLAFNEPGNVIYEFPCDLPDITQRNPDQTTFTRHTKKTVVNTTIIDHHTPFYPAVQ